MIRSRKINFRKEIKSARHGAGGQNRSIASVFILVTSEDSTEEKGFF